MRNSRTTDKGPSQRQLRVGEEVRHGLSTILMRHDFRGASEVTTPVTVTEVRMTADLKSAVVFISPLTGAGSKQSAQDIIKILAENAHDLQRQLAKQVELRFVPKLKFRHDNSLDEAQRIHELLNDPRVKADVDKDT